MNIISSQPDAGIASSLVRWREGWRGIPTRGRHSRPAAVLVSSPLPKPMVHSRGNFGGGPGRSILARELSRIAIRPSRGPRISKVALGQKYRSWVHGCCHRGARRSCEDVGDFIGGFSLGTYSRHYTAPRSSPHSHSFSCSILATTSPTRPTPQLNHSHISRALLQIPHALGHEPGSVGTASPEAANTVSGLIVCVWQEKPR